MRSRFLLLATLILLTAAVLRLYDLHEYPPGPHYDEAVYLIVSRNIAFGGARFFPMVEAYQGREVLYMYLNAPFLQWIHDDIFTLHMVSAFCNLITVAATIALGRLMFRGRRGWIIGLTMGVLIALSFPQIWLARQAFRAVTLPFMQSIALVFLWRGLTAKRRDWLWLIIGGFLAGATVYTYNSSRLFPLWLGIAGLALLIVDRAHWRLRLRQGVIFFGVLILIAAPMAIYAMQRPDIFFGRLSEVTQADQSVTLWESILLHARMFFIEGDPYLRYNIPLRPYFTLPEGLLMLIGIGVALGRLVRRGNPMERVAYLLALLSPLMVIPSVISVGGLPPSHMRSLGMIPLIFVLVAVGAEWVIERIIRLFDPTRLPHPHSLRSSPPLPRERGLGGEAVIAVIAVLLIGGVLVGQTYFTWAARTDVFYETDADLSAAARWLVTHHTDEIVYIAARDKGHPTAMIEPIPPVTWLGTDLLFRAPQGQTGLYIFPRSAPPPDEWRAWLEPGAIPDLPLAPDGRTAFEAFRITGDTPLPDFIAAQAENPYLSLIGLDALPIPSGETGTIQIAWQIKTRPPYRDFTPLIQLEDDLGNILARTEPYMTLTDAWRAGETLMQRIAITVPPATPPGDYHIRVTWVARASDAYLSYLDSAGLAGIWAEVGIVTVLRPDFFPNASTIETLIIHDIQISSDFRLIGYTGNEESYRPGEMISMALYWNTSAEGQQPVTITARLGTTPLEQWMPFDGYAWREGETLAERRRFMLPRDLPGGDYSLFLNDEMLTTVHIEGVAREFELPPIDNLLNIVFGNQLELVGYNVEREGENLFVDVTWRSTVIIDQSFKFFMHFLDSSGRILQQIDTMPRENTYPTQLWAAGEVVTETYQVTITNELDTLRIGVYDSQTMERLFVGESGNQTDYVDITIR